MVQESLKRDILDWETRPARHSTSFWRRLMRNRLGFASLIFIVFVVLAATVPFARTSASLANAIGVSVAASTTIPRATCPASD